MKRDRNTLSIFWTGWDNRSAVPVCVPTGLARQSDWSDLVASRAPTPLFVQYNRGDPHFPLQGMQETHQRLIAHYQNTHRPDAYRGEFYVGQHQFDLPMQASAFAWLKEWLA